MLKFSKLLVKLTRWLSPAVVVLLPFLLCAEPSFAFTNIFSGQEGWDAFIGGFMMVLSLIIVGITMLSYLFALGVGYLLDSTFIFGSGMGDTLYSIWAVMRNFVNVAFILILLIVAVMVIFGSGGEKGLGMLKKILPKFVLALVLVNMTFLGGRFILTTNDVLTTAIFAIPKTVSGDKMVKMPCEEGLSLEECVASINKQIEDELAANKTNSAGYRESGVKKMKNFIEKLQANASNEHAVKDMVGTKSVALILVSELLDLDTLVNVKGLSGDGWDALVGGLGSLVMAGAVGIVIFMLFVALIVRMVVLWLCIAVSPLAALAIVLKDVIPGADMKGDFDLMNIFIKHAFMPMMVAIPISVGLTMIFVNNTVDLNIQNMTISSLSDSFHSGNIHALLLWVAAIIIIWFGTNKMIQKASPEFAAKLTDGIHNGVNNFVKGAAGTLKYAPIVPTWAGGSISGALNQPALMESAFKKKADERSLEGWGGKMGTESWVGLNKINNVEKSADKKGSYQEMLNSPEAMKELMETHSEDAAEARLALAKALEIKNIPENTSTAWKDPVEFKKFIRGATVGRSDITGTRNGGEMLNTWGAAHSAAQTAKESGEKISEQEGQTVSKDEVTGGESSAGEGSKAVKIKKGDDEFYANKVGDNYTIIMNVNDKSEVETNINNTMEAMKQAHADKDEKGRKEYESSLLTNLKSLGRVGTQKERDEMLKKLKDNKGEYGLSDGDIEKIKTTLDAK